MTSDVFEILVQRRLRAPLSVLDGQTRSRTLNKNVDMYGDMHQNLKAHGTRHNQPLKKLLNMFRAVYGRSVRMEDKTHGVYSPGVQPDLTHFKGAKDGTHHILYELKVVNPCSSDDAGTGALGGAVAFGNTADGLYS